MNELILSVVGAIALSYLSVGLMMMIQFYLDRKLLRDQYGDTPQMRKLLDYLVPAQYIYVWLFWPRYILRRSGY